MKSTETTNQTAPKAILESTVKGTLKLTGKQWSIDGQSCSNADAMGFMKAKGYAVPLWLEREVRTGLTLEQRRERRAMAASNRLRENAGEWK